MIESLQTFVSLVSATTESWIATRNHQNSWKKSSITEKKNFVVVDDDDDDNDEFGHLIQYTLAEVSEHWQTDDCWIVVEDLVYDVTNFLDEHPGGHYIMMEHAGRDATMVFRGSRHSQDAYDMLDKYLIGALVQTERIHWGRSSRSNSSSSGTSSTGSLYGSSLKPSIGL